MVRIFEQQTRCPSVSANQFRYMSFWCLSSPASPVGCVHCAPHACERCKRCEIDASNPCYLAYSQSTAYRSICMEIVLAESLFSPSCITSRIHILKSLCLHFPPGTPSVESYCYLPLRPLSRRQHGRVKTSIEI
jgi:hypothetical protein